MNKRKLVLWNPIKGRTRLRMPPLSLGIIAALTTKDWDVVIRDENFDELKTEPCDLVGITAMTPQILGAYEIAKKYRKLNIPVVLGGIHATMCPEEALNYVDVIVKGEAELIWQKLLEDFDKGKLKKIYEAKSRFDLTNSPTPSYHLFNPKYKCGIIQTTRGCPCNCEFCSVTAFNGGTYRKYPIEKVLNETEMIPQKFFMFADDNLSGFSKSDHERFIALCQGMIDRKINKTWIAQVSFQFTDNDEIMSMAKKAGCLGVLIGIESVSSQVLSGNMNKNMNIKYLKRKGDFVKRLHGHKLALMGTFIMGNDEDTYDSFEQTYKGIKKLKIDDPTIMQMIPYPGTKLWDRLLKEGRILYTNFPHDWKYYVMPFDAKIPLFKLKNMSEEDFQNRMKWLCEKLYSWKNIFFRSLNVLFYTRSLYVFLLLLGISLNRRRLWIVKDGK